MIKLYLNLIIYKNIMEISRNSMSLLYHLYDYYDFIEHWLDFEELQSDLEHFYNYLWDL
jgi:hypothetical protein